MFNVRTDLAVEAREIYMKENNGEEIKGVKTNEYSEGHINITKVKILDEEGEKAMGKPKGDYITIEIPESTFYDAEIKKELVDILGKEISSLINIDKNMTAMVAGLGNGSVTPDSLGPKVISKLMITRHLKELIPDKIDERIRPVCAIAPGVLGTTGIETGEVLKAIIKKIKPNVLICVDALASRRLERVNRTIQIGNTGISPGAGVGNKRMELSKETLGIPVIAIGVPTVVDAAIVANDAIDLVIDALIEETKKDSDFYNLLKNLNKNEKENLIKEVLNPYIGDLMVTPKEVDMIIDSLSKIIADGVNISLQPELRMEDINRYLS